MSLEQPAQPGATGLASLYSPELHEPFVRARWEAGGAFHADARRVLEGAAQPYCVLIPPPNVTAQLHLGHALNNTLQDVLVRSKRMAGFETLWMPGTDHAGIATQAVVEKRLRAEGKLKGPLKDAMSREEFVGQVQAWKDEYERVITNQLKMMGCSCDWERQRFTMDPQCARAVYEAFFRFFKDGLIYRGKRLVNWDPALQTAVADDECYDEEIDGNFYYLRYPLVTVVNEPLPSTVRASSGSRSSVQPVTWGKLRSLGWNEPQDADHPSDAPAWITVATTRPETFFGDTAVAINPRDPRAGALRGLSVALPIIGRVVPIVEDDYVVLPERFARSDEEKADPKARMATGFLKVTPAHDPNDWEIGQRHKLAVINIFAPDATISDKHGWSNADELAKAGAFLGKKRDEARKLVVIELKAQGLHEATKPHRHSVKHSDRSKAIVEPYLSDQWYVKVTDPRLAQSANEALGERGLSGVGRASSPAETARATKCDSALPHAWDRGTSANKNVSIRRLPHFEQGGSTSFVTFRTRDGHLSEAERRLVLDACFHWHGQRARFYAVTVMPDHVHMLVKPIEREPGVWYTLGEIMHAIKSFTAHEINRARKTSGAFWQDEWFDRIVRDAQEFEEKLGYIENNPVTAGLADKPGTYPFSRVVLAQAEGRSAAGGDARPTQEDAAELTFHPARYAKTYEAWHEGIRDWCISRQLWWGHQVPVWTSKGDFGLDSTELMNEAKERGECWFTRLGDHYSGYSVRHVCVRDPENKTLTAELERAGFTRDPDVLDTWFSSALWPLSTMGWPSQTPELQAFNPSSTLCTAREIITLWVSRMVMFNRYLHGEGGGRGPVPFHDVVIHAVIQDGEGRKMSKSLGNGIDPLDIIATHGSDAMRFTLCSLATQTQDVRMPVQKDAKSGRNSSPKFDLGRNFCNKLWNACRFALGKVRADDPELEIDVSQLALVDRWMLGRVHAAIIAIDKALGEYQFADYAMALYDLVWRDFCDWYLEAIKPTVEASPQQRGVLALVINVILRLAHPAMPYVTEAIYEHTQRAGGRAWVAGLVLGPARRVDSRGLGLLCTAPWPVVTPELADAGASAEFERLRSLVDAVREMRATQHVKPQRRPTLHGPEELVGAIGPSATLVKTLAGLGAIEVAGGQPPEGGVRLRSGVGGGGLGEVWLSGLVDPGDTQGQAQAHAQLTSELAAKRTGELRKQHATIAGRLANPGYVDRAPPKLVEESKAQLRAIEAELASLGAAP
jgi:valyl-tRNA synthetase